MGKYEELLNKYGYIHIEETDKLPSFQSGLTFNDEIYINSDRPKTIKLEVLAEEIAHYHITYGDITDQSYFNNRKFEGYAKRLTYNMLMPLEEVKQLHTKNITTLHDIAAHFEVTEQFVKSALSYYIKKDKIPKTILSM